MARLFVYGDTPTVIQQNKWLPGVFASAHGVNLNAPAVKPASLTIEYGEIVELKAKGIAGNASYAVARVDGQTTVFGAVVRTTDGGMSIEDEWIERPRSKTTLSVYALGAPNYYRIAVPVAPTQTPVVGGAVYIRNTGDYAGSVQTDESSAGTAGTLLVGWKFATAKYTPTKGAGEAVIIERVV